jgi:hypothetical protein
MANTLLNSTLILNEMLDVLHNSIQFTKTVDRQYDKRFASNGVSGKPGTSLQVRKPVQYSIRSGAPINLQDSTEETITINCATQKGVDLYFTSEDLTMKIEDFSERYIQPAIKRLASQIDLEGLSLFKNIYNSVGLWGTVPATAATYLEAGVKLDHGCCPSDDRYLCVSPQAQGTIIGGLSGLFNPNKAISSQYTDAKMGEALGFKWNMSQNVNSLAVGTRAGTILVNEPSGTNLVEGTKKLNIDAITGATDTIKVGEVFTVAEVYAVNPETKATLPHLQQFVVTKDAVASSNSADIEFEPAIITSGSRQTVSAMAANNAGVTFIGTASQTKGQNLAYHKKAFTLATADLELPRGVDMAARNTMDGISMRMVRQYDVRDDSFPMRVDVYYGWTTLRPEWACRVTE